MNKTILVYTHFNLNAAGRVMLRAFEDSIATNCSTTIRHYHKDSSPAREEEKFCRKARLWIQGAIQKLAQGYNVVLSDIDTIWFKDPAIVFDSTDNTDDWDIAHCPKPVGYRVNTGVLFFRPTLKAIIFLINYYRNTCAFSSSKERISQAKAQYGGSDQAGFCKALEQVKDLRVKHLDWKAWNLCQDFNKYYDSNTVGVVHLKGRYQREFTRFDFHSFPEDLVNKIQVFWEQKRYHVLYNYILENYGKDIPLTGVEVGVWKATCSTFLLKYLPKLTLHVIDPWKDQSDNWEYRRSGDTLAPLGSTAFEESYSTAKKNLEPFVKQGRAIIHRCTSEQGRNLFPTVPSNVSGVKGVDFVFIDADHSYGAVRRDIAMWETAIRSGGFISGHDYDHPSYPDFGVTKAVDEKYRDRSINGCSLILGADYTWIQPLN